MVKGMQIIKFSPKQLLVHAWQCTHQKIESHGKNFIPAWAMCNNGKS